MKLLFLSAALSIVWGATVAGAQDSADTDDTTARSFYEAGVASYDSGHFEAALSAFAQGYELSGRAQFLFNMASSLDRLHRTEEARDMYQRYADAEPESEQSALVQRRIRVLSEELARQPASVEPVVAPAPAAETEPTPTDRVQQPTTRSGFLSAPALAGFGVGAAGLITFAVSGAISKSKFSDLEDTCAPGCQDSEVSPARRTALIADIGLGVGVAGLAFGLIYALVAGPGDSEPEQAALSVHPIRAGAAMQFERLF